MPSALRLLVESFSPRALASLLSTPRFWALYALVASPVVLLATDATDQAAWLVFGFSLVWAVLFEAMVRPERGTALLAALVFTASAGVSAPLLMGFLATTPAFSDPLAASARLGVRAAGLLGIGLREETFKLLPFVAVAIWRSRAGAPFTLRQGLVLGAMCGVAFAASENVQYLVRFENHDRAQLAAGLFSQLSLEGALTRALLTPFMHGAWTGIAGFFLAWAGRAATQRWSLRAAGLATAVVLHAAYNLSAPLPWVVLVMILATFHLFVRCVARARAAGWALTGAGTA